MPKLLAIFAKHWTPGRVKTRLAAALGAARAAAIHRLFVETLIARFGQIADERVVVFTPNEMERSFRDLAGDKWQAMPQSDGDLGCRMKALFATSTSQYD